MLVDKDQNVYEGEFRTGLKHGMGKLQMVNGDMYTGEFAKGLYHGKVIGNELDGVNFFRDKLFARAEKFIQEILLKEKRMDMVIYNLPLEKSMKVNSEMINTMAKVP